MDKMWKSIGFSALTGAAVVLGTPFVSQLVSSIPMMDTVVLGTTVGVLVSAGAVAAAANYAIKEWLE